MAQLDREYMVQKLLDNTGWHESTIQSWSDSQLYTIYRQEAAKWAAEIVARYAEPQKPRSAG